MPQQIFSNEIISMIIDCLQDEVPSLQRLSLVNKAWAFLSRPYIWRQIILNPPRPHHRGPAMSSRDTTPCAKLWAIINAVDSPADLIEEFCIDNTEDPNSHTLSSDRYLPMVLNRLTHLTRFKILRMLWPQNINDPLVHAIRRILHSRMLDTLTIWAYRFPTYLVRECFFVQTLLLRGNQKLYLAGSDMDPPSAESIPRPHTLALDTDSFVADQVWPLVDTSCLKYLRIALPTVLGDHPHQLLQYSPEYLAINCYEDDDFYPNFGRLDKVKELTISYPTWLDGRWPEALAGLLHHLASYNMIHLERIVLYWLLEPADTFISEADFHNHNAFVILDHQLMNMNSKRLSNVHVGLKPNSDSIEDIEGMDVIETKLANTFAANLLTVGPASGE
ncbi:hypothetical protein H0H93_013543 [Arthromyces matolae]|nr:hypothetical protein H0H93_013543 [Arthromyces matolae]